MRFAYADPPYYGCCKLYDHHLNHGRRDHHHQEVAMTSPMQAHIVLHRADNRGDHATEVEEAHAYIPDETVADMIVRVMGFPVSKWKQPDPTQFVTIRVVTGTEPVERTEPHDAPEGQTRMLGDDQ